MVENNPREKAQSLINDVRRIMARRDDLIYALNVGGSDDFDDDDPFELKALRSFSSGSVSVDPWVEIVPHNARVTDEIISPADAAYLGREYGVDIEEYGDGRGVCVHASFEY